MPPAARGWRNYHQWNPRGEGIAAVYARPFLEYLRTQDWLDRSRAVFDFGCGYFDVGLGIADRVGSVDGFDIEEHALALARARAASRSNVRVFGSADEVPRGRYDLVLAGSVFQYLGNDDNVTQTLELFRTLLRPDGRGEIILSDLIPPGFSPTRDAIRSFWVATRSGILLSMFLFLGKAVLRRCATELHKIAPERMTELANRAGFECERLAVNLSPSRQRYSCRLKLRREVMRLVA